MSTTRLEALVGSGSNESAVRVAEIGADLLSNSMTERPPALDYRIEVTFEPPAVLALGPLELPARSWENLAGTTWSPGEAPALVIEGEPATIAGVHGRLTLGGDDAEVVIVACERIAFGELDGGCLPAALELVFGGPDGKPWRLDVALTITPIRVLGDIFTKPRPDLDQALELAREHLDLARLKPRVTDGIVVLDHR